MKFIAIYLLISLFLHPVISKSQPVQPKNIFTRDDTLRGRITEYRKGWDVIKYELTVKPNISAKTIEGKNTITYYESLAVRTMQIDLQQPLIADSIIDDNGGHYTFRRENNVCFVQIRDSLAMYKIAPS